VTCTATVLPNISVRDPHTPEMSDPQLPQKFTPACNGV